MSKKRGRGLSEEDRQLWERVARTATPMKRQKPISEVFEPEISTPKPPVSKGEPVFSPSPFRIGDKARGHMADHGPTQAKPPELRMDRKTFQRMRRGKSKPDARIDLHGMTVAVAHPALVSFVLKCQGRGDRLLLVITGKGRGGEDEGPVPARRGILRQQVPHWLTVPPLASIVLQVERAHDRHGGSGAFYVYLRRR